MRSAKREVSPYFRGWEEGSGRRVLDTEGAPAKEDQGAEQKRN